MRRTTPSFLLPGGGRAARLADWLRAHGEVLRVLGDARGLAEAAPRLFGVIGPGMRMDAGVLWLIEHRTGALRSAYVWQGRHGRAPTFDATVRRASLRSGEGLAGAAWARMAPVWRPARAPEGGRSDLVSDAARTDGLRLGAAFPIRCGGDFHGVIELAAHKARRDVDDLEIEMQGLGETLGQFLVRQATLQRLGSSERQLAELFENAPLGLVVADAKGRIVRANQAELDMLGFARDAYVGHPLSEFHLDPDAIAELLARVAKGEEVRGFEARVRRADGTEAWIRLHANGFFEDGRLLQVRCFSRDVTKEREAARTLKESEERFRLLVEGARDYALHTYGPDGRVAAWSLGAANLFGWSDEDAAALQMASLFCAEDQAEGVPGRTLRLAEDEGRLLHEGWLVRKDGSRFWAQVSLTAVRDPGGRVTHVCQLTRDATESRRVETLRRKTSELEAANNAVLVAQRRATEMLDGLRAAIETPLRAVERLPGLLEDGAIEEAATTAQGSAAALRRALEEARATGALEPAPGATADGPVDPFRLASEVRDMLRDAAAERRIRVEVDVDPELGPVVVAADRLRQVLFNLVSNAIRFNRDRGRVTVRFLREGDAAFRLEIEDTGVGIPDEQVRALVDGGGDVQGLPSEAKIGLSATRGVVADLGGRLAVRSAPGRGSVFSVILPRMPGSGPSPQRTGAPTGGKTLPPARILVVERDPAVRASLAWTLGGAGYEVESVATALEGIEAARAQRFDAVAAPLDAEEGGVVDVVAGIRSGGQSHAAPLVIALVHGEDGHPGALIVDDVVPRPTPADRFFAALERARVPRGRARPLLLVDADLAVLASAARTLEVLDYRVVAEPDADAALRAAAEEAPAAVLFSPFPLVLDAFQLLHHLRRLPGLGDVPALLCVPPGSAMARSEALRAAVRGPWAQLPELLGELERRLHTLRGSRRAAAPSR